MANTNSARHRSRGAIDISSDMGEGFALPPFGLELETIKSIVVPRTGERFHERHSCTRHDDAVLSVVSSLSLACGLHSGDAVLLNRWIPAALSRRIRLGAHPSYPDLFRFGQRRMDLAAPDLEAVILYQLGALSGLLAAHRSRIQHVKCHGALQFDVSYEEHACRALISAIKKFDPSIIVVLLSGAPMVQFAKASGLTVAEEIAIDRGYDREGRMLPRSHAQALLSDPAEVAIRIARLVRSGELVAHDGSIVRVSADTVCLHSDSPGAEAFVPAIRRALDREGVKIRPIGEFLVEP
jgi:5-oxoprolinase (ATP-hydrolysing) subunit A